MFDSWAYNVGIDINLVKVSYDNHDYDCVQASAVNYV